MFALQASYIRIILEIATFIIYLPVELIFETSQFGFKDRLSFSTEILNLSYYSCSSYPTRASYSGQVDGFRNPMKNELKTRPCLNTRV